MVSKLPPIFNSSICAAHIPAEDVELSARVPAGNHSREKIVHVPDCGSNLEGAMLARAGDPQDLDVGDPVPRLQRLHAEQLEWRREDGAVVLLRSPRDTLSRLRRHPDQGLPNSSQGTARRHPS